MKLAFILVLIFASILSAVARAGSVQETIKVAADPWCPFTCSARSVKPGLMVELLRAALGKEVAIEYKEMPWARAIEETRRGEINGIVGALKADAPDFIYPAVPAGLQKSCFFVGPKSTWKYTGIASLKGKTLGAVKNYTYGEPIDAYIEKSKDLPALDFMTGVNAGERLLRKLSDDRIEITIEDASVAEYLQKEHPELAKAGIKKAGCLKPQPLYIAFSPESKVSKELAQKFSQGMRALKAQKKDKVIYSKYGL